ncbi:IS630 family transposase [Salmonella enterica]|nr:IS630 family transposase [Salmonella enterica subsp. enterica serovar Claibornei]EDW6544831.1 IS630 family transposase [Salmonella enterica subsp. enterica]EKP5053962.1 IS630 family transposase [Salmonella enterica]
MKIHLTSEQRTTLKILHKSSRDSRLCDRIRCVLLAADGWNAAMIAKSQLIDETTVRRHLNDWLSEEKLKPENGGSQGYLSETQTAELVEYLTNNLLPTTAAIINVIKERWNIRYTVPGLNKWLHKQGFSYRKPVGIPHKFSVEAQMAFVAAYEQLKQDAGADEPVLFIDGVHPTQGTKLAYGWMRAGKGAKQVETSGSRTRLNLMGAINLSDISKTVVCEHDSINSLNIARFFIEIRKTYPVSQKVHIILDGAGYHRSELVKDWAVVMNIALHYLPPYSPNLNPIERLWKVMNEEVRNNRYFASAEQFRREIRGFFYETLPAMAGKLSSRINDNFHMLKNASSS